METNETNVTNEQTNTNETNENTTTQETTAPTKKELLREMSKEYGVNLFDAEGLQAFKEYTESQKSEQERLQEQLTTLNTEKATWESEKLGYEAKLKAMELGIAPKQVDDALKLADGDPNKLAEVIKKYPTFQNSKGIQIGVQDGGDTNPTGKTEVEQYMAKNYQNNPYYKKK